MVWCPGCCFPLPETPAIEISLPSVERKPGDGAFGPERAILGGKAKIPDPHIADMECEATITGGGNLRLPAEVAGVLRSARGMTVKVRLRSPEHADALAERRVTDEEIARISTLQAEKPEAVIRFLVSEGVLRRRGNR